MFSNKVRESIRKLNKMSKMWIVNNTKDKVQKSENKYRRSNIHLIVVTGRENKMGRFYQHQKVFQR